MHAEAAANNPTAAPAGDNSGAEPLILDNLEGVFLLCALVTAAALVAIAVETAVGKNMTTLLECLGLNTRMKRDRDKFARRRRATRRYLTSV